MFLTKFNTVNGRIHEEVGMLGIVEKAVVGSTMDGGGAINFKPLSEKFKNMADNFYGEGMADAVVGLEVCPCPSTDEGSMEILYTGMAVKLKHLGSLPKR